MDPHVFKAVIFDLDQTLVYTLERFYKVFNLTLEKFGDCYVEWDVFLKHYSDDSLNSLIPPSCDRETFWRVFLKSYCDVNCSSDSLIPDVEAVLSCLKSHGFKIAVVTGRGVSVKRVWEELKFFGISSYVDYVATCESTLNGKLFSKSEILLEVFSFLDVNASQCIVVGDYWADVRSGRSVGAGLVVGVLTGLMDPNVLKENGADIILNSVADLPLLLKLNCG